MPYVNSSARAALDKQIATLSKALIEIGRPGDEFSFQGNLNYAITKLCVDTVRWKGKSYGVLSAVAGVLADARDEFYRRVVAPYEEKKALANGDCYKEIL